MDLLLKNKTVVVTGSGRGIGRVIAKEFAKEGANVVISSRSIQDCNTTKSEIEAIACKAEVVIADMSDKKQIKHLIETAYKAYGSVDILVNNAGLPTYTYAIDNPSEEAEDAFEKLMDTNFRGYWYAIRYAVPYMKKAGAGSIINISSVRGHGGVKNESAYCCSKGAINMLTKSLAVELAGSNIRVNTVSPGAIQVESVGHWIHSRFSEEVRKEYEEKFTDAHFLGMKVNQPLHQLGASEDIANTVMFLASKVSAFTTGAELLVDGGMTATLPEPTSMNLASINDYYIKSQEMSEWLSEQK